MGASTPAARRKAIVWGVIAAVAAAIALVYVDARPAPPRDARGAAAPLAEDASGAAPASRRATTPEPRAAPEAGVARRSHDEEGDDLSDDPAVRAVRAAAADESPAGTRSLLQSLDSSDPVVRLEAVDALVERRHTAAIPLLAKMSTSDPFVAPTIIEGLGRLGEQASDDRLRRVALDRLIGLLAEEKQRGAPESMGNALTVVEALGALRHEGGAPVLEPELDGSFFDLAGQTTVVQALARIARPASRGPLEALRARLLATPPSDEAMTNALVGELLSNVDVAVGALSAPR
ncbi:MAG: HEAT repeat domain-containing protein [Labilithrix sp.]|nr:HEAT repeat domain-containing protein [Labilithrix sp.]